MQNSATAKTKWAPKQRIWVAGTVALATVLVAVLIWLLWPSGQVLQAGNKQYRVEVADTQPERKQGLSGRHSLADGHGMLFVFPEAGRRCFWMKDMQFSIDIIWLDQRKQVVDLLANVAPDTYPHSFCSPNDAMYVLELKAGEVKAADIQKGQTISF